MYLKFHITFEDQKGIEITNQKLIALHYLKSKTGFVVDLIAIIPFEVLSYTIPDEFYQERVYLILLLIHLVRVFRVVLMLHPDNWKVPKWYLCMLLYKSNIINLFRFKAIEAFALFTFCAIFVLHCVTSLSFFIRYGDYDSWEHAVGKDNVYCITFTCYLIRKSDNDSTSIVSS